MRNSWEIKSAYKEIHFLLLLSYQSHFTITVFFTELNSKCQWEPTGIWSATSQVYTPDDFTVIQKNFQIRFSNFFLLPECLKGQRRCASFYCVPVFSICFISSVVLSVWAHILQITSQLLHSLVQIFTLSSSSSSVNMCTYKSTMRFTELIRTFLGGLAVCFL